MLKFAFIYALPGYTRPEQHHVKTDNAEFICVAVDYAHLEHAADCAKQLVATHGVKMIELCGGLANADIVSKVKQAVGQDVAVGQVMYGPEYRRFLTELVSKQA